MDIRLVFSSSFMRVSVSLASSFGHFFAAGYGSIYPALNSLARDGLVECRHIPQEGKPDRKVYSITAAGREHLLAALAACKAEGYHRAVDTSGHAPRETMLAVAGLTDLFLYDLKLMDDESHRSWVGVGNRLILENLEALAETDSEIWVRVPLIPGVNDDEENIRATLAFIRPHKNVIDYELLPYHRFGTSKYGFLGKIYELSDFTTPSDESVQRLQAIIDEAFGRSKED